MALSPEPCELSFTCKMRQQDRLQALYYVFRGTQDSLLSWQTYGQDQANFTQVRAESNIPQFHKKLMPMIVEYI